ncbi:MAG: DUF6502 family protein [Pseudomonadota bacterium]
MQQACRWILRPLVKAMIANGLTLPTLVATLKGVFVDVAEKEFQLDGKPLTDSRISMLTGVHRKDVRALRQAESSIGSPRGGVAATVVGRWLGDPRFLDDTGHPRMLQRQSTTQSPVSFEGLVAEVSTDIRARTVLDELLRQELVEVDSKTDQIRLLAEAFLPQPGSEALFEFYRLNLHDHLAAATENLLHQENTPPFFERAVYYDGLSPESVDELEEDANLQGLQLLQDLNAKALSRQRRDRTHEGPRRRIRVGLYVYHEDQPSDASSETAPSRGSKR